MTLTRDNLLRAAWIGTVVFVGTAFGAVFSDVAKTPAWLCAMLLFAAGAAAYLAAYARIVRRSRLERVELTGFIFLAGSAPAGVRRLLVGCTVVQLAVALITAGIRPYTSLAFGIMTPMYGLGLQALWAAYFGTFPRREADAGKKNFEEP